MSGTASKRPVIQVISSGPCAVAAALSPCPPAHAPSAEIASSASATHKTRRRFISEPPSQNGRPIIAGRLTEATACGAAASASRCQWMRTPERASDSCSPAIGTSRRARRSRAANAAAVPAAWPVSTAGGMTRETSHAWPSASMLRPAVMMLSTPSATRVPYGISYTGPERLKSLMQAIESSACLPSSASVSRARPTIRRVVRNCAIAGIVITADDRESAAAISRRSSSRPSRMNPVTSRASSPTRRAAPSGCPLPSRLDPHVLSLIARRTSAPSTAARIASSEVV